MITETQNIRDLRQWLCWRIEERDGKPTKVPYSPLTGKKASTTDPQTWASYPEAVEAYREHGYGGIGFAFGEDDPFCGVDLDGCLNPEAGEIEGWAQEIMEELDSYTEISPSGKGVHVLVRATLPEGRNRKGRFEAYDRGLVIAGDKERQPLPDVVVDFHLCVSGYDACVISCWLLLRSTGAATEGPGGSGTGEVPATREDPPSVREQYAPEGDVGNPKDVIPGTGVRRVPPTGGPPYLALGALVLLGGR